MINQEEGHNKTSPASLSSDVIAVNCLGGFIHGDRSVTGSHWRLNAGFLTGSGVPDASDEIAMLNCGVIFDMDGVLVDSYAAHLASWKRLADELGAAITDGQFSATFGRTSREIIRQLFDVTENETVARYDARKEALYRDIIRGRVPVMVGAIELVTTLHEAGFRLAVGSSGPPENIALVCKDCGLDAMLAGRVSGADVTHGKPDPEVFLLAAERIGVGPERCVVVEDAPAGVEAAVRAGMRCIGLAGTVEPKRLGQADLVVNRLNEIDADVVRKLFA